MRSWPSSKSVVPDIGLESAEGKHIAQRCVATLTRRAVTSTVQSSTAATVDRQLSLAAIRSDPRQDRPGIRAGRQDGRALDDHTSRRMRAGQPPNQCLLKIVHGLEDRGILAHGVVTKTGSSWLAASATNLARSR